MGYFNYICKFCKKKFTRYTSPSRKPFQYCSRGCASRATSPGQRSYEALFERWKKKYGEDEALQRLEENKKKRSKIASIKNTGRQLSDKTKQKISKSCEGNSNVLKGKTYIEFYGKERAQQLSKQHSQKLKEGYASGRISPNAHSNNAPKYKGIQLRSKLEFDIILYLEKTQDLIFGENLLYEHQTTRVKWIDDNGVDHVYTPDLYDVRNNIVYEVKPYWMTQCPTKEMLHKERAAKQKLKDFRYLTDKILVALMVS